MLRTDRLVLSIPTPDDADAVFEYCQDPLFETLLTVPWPYRAADAEFFVGTIAPRGWDHGSEYIWALREHEGGPLLGVVGLHRRRATEPASLDVGYWLGAPHRGHSYMSESVRTVTAWAFETQLAEVIYWECLVGNISSAATAHSSGFEFTGVAPSHIAMRDGSHPEHWHCRLRPDASHGPYPPRRQGRTHPFDEPSGAAPLPWPPEVATSSVQATTSHKDPR